MRTGLPQKCLDALRIFSLASESGKRTIYLESVWVSSRSFGDWFRPRWKEDGLDSFGIVSTSKSRHREDQKCSAFGGHFYISWLHEAVTCNAPLWQLHFGSVSIFADRCRPRGPHFAAWNQKRSCFSDTNDPMQLARRSKMFASFPPMWFLPREKGTCLVQSTSTVWKEDCLERFSDFNEGKRPYRKSRQCHAFSGQCFHFTLLRKAASWKTLFRWWGFHKVSIFTGLCGPLFPIKSLRFRPSWKEDGLDSFGIVPTWKSRHREDCKEGRRCSAFRCDCFYMSVVSTVVFLQNLNLGRSWIHFRLSQPLDTVQMIQEDALQMISNFVLGEKLLWRLPQQLLAFFGFKLSLAGAGLPFKFLRCSEDIFTHVRTGLPQKCLDALRIFSLASESGKRTIYLESVWHGCPRVLSVTGFAQAEKRMALTVLGLCPHGRAAIEKIENVGIVSTWKSRHREDCKEGRRWSAFRCDCFCMKRLWECCFDSGIFAEPPFWGRSWILFRLSQPLDTVQMIQEDALQMKFILHLSEDKFHGLERRLLRKCLAALRTFPVTDFSQADNEIALKAFGFCSQWKTAIQKVEDVLPPAVPSITVLEAKLSVAKPWHLSFKFKDSQFVKFSVGRRLCDGYFAISSWIGHGSFQVKVSQGLQVSRQRVLIYGLQPSRPGRRQRLRGMNSKRASTKPWCCL